MDLDVLKNLSQPGGGKIILLVLDGLGGLGERPGAPTELEEARTPNLDRLAREGVCGLHEPVGPGIIPGSGPAHLGLFGYDPVKYLVGRGVLAALGTDFDIKKEDVAARGNFCTIGPDGVITDRRAGRISTEKCAELCERLEKEVEIPGVQVFVRPVKEHRFLFVLRGQGLSQEVSETDPNEVGRKPLDPEAKAPAAEKTARAVAQFVEKARSVLADSHPANMVLLRGFAQLPDMPLMPEIYGMRFGAVAAYPMYRGLARLVGMTLLDAGSSVEEEFAAVEKNWDAFDFFFIHVKGTDSAGEDGDRARKIAVIEETDALVPRLRALGPDVIVVTGDHSTPAVLKSHSWHPVPVLLWSERCRADSVETFGETACTHGGLGARFPATHIIPLAMANAHRLTKFGA